MTLAQRLRAALDDGAKRQVDLLAGDMRGERDPAFAGMAAAVLVPITDRPRPGVILTLRDAALRHHAGQVSFPGGRIDPGDAGPTAAALREAHEELALDPGLVDVIGETDRYRTVTGFDIVPVMGVVPPDLPLSPSDGEVADWFEVPLDHLFDPANHREAFAHWGGYERHYFEITWRDRRIWGATAAMIVNLGRRLAWRG